MTTASIQTKSDNIAAHQARNAAAKAQAAERRLSRRSMGEINTRMHNAKLKFARLEKKRLATLKPHEMTYEQATLFEGTSDEGSQASTIFYAVPMTKADFVAGLPANVGTRIWDEFTEMFDIASCGADSLNSIGASLLGTIESEKDGTITISAGMVLTDVPAALLSARENTAYHAGVKAFHEHLLSIGAVVTEYEDSSEA